MLVQTVLHVPFATVTLLAQDHDGSDMLRGMADPRPPHDTALYLHTLRQADPFVVADTTADPRFAAGAGVEHPSPLRSYAGVPLKTRDGYHVGTLSAFDVAARRFTAAELLILQNFAKIVISELELRRIIQRDALTGTLNRHGFVEQVTREIEAFRRHHQPSALLMVDIDHFKQVNDSHGHPAGDAVLRSIAATLSQAVPPDGVVGRIGGEEFGILLPRTAADAALHAAERFRRAIESSGFDAHATPPLRVTASFGIAPIDSAIASAEGWIARADAPLYQSKRRGRNRCSLVDAA